MRSVPSVIFPAPARTSLFAAALCAGAPAMADPAKLEAEYHRSILPIFENYCYDCHGDGVKKGEFALDRYPDVASMIADRDVWKRIREHIDFRLMPPPDEAAPADAERRALLEWIDNAVFPVDPANPDPGQVTLRRLNRAEYRNTLRDLLGVEVDVETLLPADDSGYGFDNIGDVLTLSPAHLERYLIAAQQALDLATHPGPMPPERRDFPANLLQGDGEPGDRGRYLIKNGEAFATLAGLPAGRYRVDIAASGTPADGQPPTLDFIADGAVLQTWEIRNRVPTPQHVSYEWTLAETRDASIGLRFANDAWLPDHPDPDQRDRNLMLHHLAITGPLDGPPPPKPETHRRIYGERPAGISDEAYMTGVLSRFARRAFRREVPPEETNRYLVFLKRELANGGDVDHAIRTALEAMLVSPSFLFREEPVVAEGDGGRALISEHALASRLSYFLWSSMPDDRLLDLAAAGQLRAELGGEIRRMLASEKSQTFVENFTGQWLQLRDLRNVAPDHNRFRDFDQDLAQAMRRETELLFREVLAQNLPAGTLLDADFTFLNERLARHYGIGGVEGDDFRRVSLAGTSRRGILNHGSVLTLTSYPTRTSPVLRGKYVLENLLATPPPPPPQNIPQLTPETHGQEFTLRQQMERHRDDPACASCHALMDPIGFGLENYDATGAWRDHADGLPIDPAGKLVTGEPFKTPEELRDLIAHDYRRQFHRAFASKTLTYALGRGLDWYDRPAIDSIVMKAEADDGRFLTLVEAVIDSVPFQYRRH